MTTDETPILAGRFRRLVAWGVDAALVPTLTILLVMIAGVVEDAEDFSDNLWILWVFCLAVVSYLMLNGYGLFTKGQTLGKKLLGIAIVASPSGDAVAFWKLVCVRALFFPISYLLVLPPLTLLSLLDQGLIFRGDRRCLHDLIAGTMVIKLGSR